VETAAVLLACHDAEQDLAEAFDGLRTGLAIGGGDTDALRLRQLPFQFAAPIGQFEEPLPPGPGAAGLNAGAPPNELAQDPVEALLCDAQDAEQGADRHLRMPPDKVDDPVMRPPETVLLEDRVGLGCEVAIGEEQQLDPLPHLFLAQERRLA